MRQLSHVCVRVRGRESVISPGWDTGPSQVTTPGVCRCPFSVCWTRTHDIKRTCKTSRTTELQLNVEYNHLNHSYYWSGEVNLLFVLQGPLKSVWTFLSIPRRKVVAMELFIIGEDRSAVVVATFMITVTL